MTGAVVLTAKKKLEAVESVQFLEIKKLKHLLQKIKISLLHGVLKKTKLQKKLHLL
jgi:hypothetical protein